MKKFVFILDALKSNKFDYIDSKLSDDLNFIEVIPPFTFEPDASYLCGKHPEDSNSGLKYWKSNTINKSTILKLLSFFPSGPRLLRKAINLILSQIPIPALKKLHHNYACIPFKLLKYFELSEERNLFQKNSGSLYPTIFDKIHSDYFYIGTPNTSGKLDYIKTQLTKDVLLQHDLFFVYISDLDSVGHKFGGNSKEYDHKLVEIMDYIESLIDQFEKVNKEVKYVIFGDHGMVNINRYIDVKKIIKNLPLKEETDYIYFLDSTLARFWFKNEKSKKIIMDTFSEIPEGSWINEKEIKDYKIKYNHNKFGDAIWWVHDKTIISPNFWQCEKKLKGMHGYRKQVHENHTCLITNDNNITNKNAIEMIEIYTILKKFLQINE